MKIKLISKNNLQRLIQSDPHQQNYSTEKYYKFGIKTFYLKKIKLAIKLLGNKKYNKLLDIGFGGGVITPELSKHCKKYNGIDKNSNIELIKEITKDEGLENVNLQFSNALELPFADNTFDCVWCMSVLEFITDSEKVVKEIKRVAQNNATIIIGFPVTNKLTNLAYKLIGFKSSEIHQNNHQVLIQQIKKHFKIEKIKKIPNYCFINYSLFVVLKLNKQT